MLDEGSRLSRRAALAWIFGTTGVALLAACGPQTQAPAAPAATGQPAGNAPAAQPTAAPLVASTPAAAQSAPAAAGAPKRGGTITAAQQNDWEGFDPHRQTSSPNAFPLIYDTLVRWSVQPDGTLKAEPGLATEWQLDAQAAIFKLRQGVKFHDGSDWNAEVAKFNIERLMDEKSSARSFVASISSAEVVDPYTLKLNLKTPAGSLLSNLSQAADGRTFMISKAMAEKAGDKYGTSPETTAGTGPMKLVEWVQGSNHVAQRTGEYWEKGADGQPLPYFDTLNVRFIADDSVRMVELRSGNVDVINNVQAKDVQTAQQDPAIDLVENPYQVSAYQFTFSAKSEKFNNLKLRQAVQYAINRDAVAKVLGQGIGSPMPYFLVKGYLGYDESLPHYTFDQARAKQLLSEAGYPDGLDITLSTINRSVDQQQAQILKQMLEQVGIRTNLEVLERIAWVNKMQTLDYDMSTYFTTMRPDPDSILGGRFETGDGKNYSGMSDPVLDDLLAKGRSSYNDSEREAAYKDVQKRIYETAWYGTIWFRKYFDAFKKTIKGHQPTQEPDWGLRPAWIDK
jgi:peptide/nickel transport system substrate-binding protein